MDKGKEKTSKMDFEFLIKYCQDRGINVTIDRNPSPEKVAYIKEQIAKMRAKNVHCKFIKKIT